MIIILFVLETRLEVLFLPRKILRISGTEIGWLVIFGKTLAVCSENETKHINKLRKCRVTESGDTYRCIGCTGT